MSWWLWLLLGVLALAGEAASMALFLLNVGLAAFVAGALAAFGLGLAVQIVVFVAVSILLIGLVRPHLLNALVGRETPRLAPAQDSLVARIATVTEAVTDADGTIRVGRGEFWTARANPPATFIEAGSRVRIVRVEGLTAYVDPLPAPVATPETADLPLAAPAARPEAHDTAASSPTFGELLRRHRTAAGLTQEALAERAGLSVRAISDLERGLHRSPQKETVHLLAAALRLADEDRSVFEAAARRLGDPSSVHAQP